jgi:hypothetical protein
MQGEPFWGPAISYSFFQHLLSLTKAVSESQQETFVTSESANEGLCEGTSYRGVRRLREPKRHGERSESRNIRTAGRKRDAVHELEIGEERRLSGKKPLLSFHLSSEISLMPS